LYNIDVDDFLIRNDLICEELMSFAQKLGCT
jgi:hypothetical protein